jgi:hypothetical protein
MIETDYEPKDHSPEGDHKSKGTQDKEILQVLEALESQGFRLIDNHEN